MGTLYVTEQGTSLRKTSGRLVVARKREVLAEIPCAKLETIFLYGAVQVTSQALAELLDQASSSPSLLSAVGCVARSRRRRQRMLSCE